MQSIRVYRDGLCTSFEFTRHWTGKGKFTAGRWHDFAVHVLWSRDATKGFVEVWFDGELVVPRVKTATLLDENVAFFQLGLICSTIEIPETIIIDHVIEATLKEVTPPQLAENRKRAELLHDRLANYYSLLNSGTTLATIDSRSERTTVGV